MSWMTLVQQASDPAAPSTGQGRIYIKTDKGVYVVDDAGAVRRLDVSTDADAIHVNVADEINQITNEPDPKAGDVVVLESAANSWAKRRASLATILADADGGVRTGSIDGLGVTWTSAGTVTIAAGAVRADTDNFNIVLASPQVVNLTIAGANGLDAGSEAASTWYSVWLIGDSTGTNPTAGLLSASSTSPSLPAGYDRKARLLFVYNAASSDLLRYRLAVEGRRRVVFWDQARSSAPQRVLAGGGATAWANVDISAVVPPIDSVGYFSAQQTAGAVASQMRPLNSNDAGGTRVCPSADGLFFDERIEGAARTMQYQNTAGGGSLTLDVVGFSMEAA